MWKDSIRNIVVIFQPNISRIVGFYVRHWAYVDMDFLEFLGKSCEECFDNTVLLKKLML